MSFFGLIEDNTLVMDESDSSSSDSSIGQILMKYRNKVREDRISNCLSIEPSQKSNINININLPTTSGSFSVSLTGGSAPSKREKKKTIPKKAQKENTARKNKSKANTPGSNTPKSSEIEGDKADPDYIPKSRYNYCKLSSKELDSIASRARVFCETGVVLSDEEDIVPCQNKYKKKPAKKTVWKERGPRVCGTKYGKGRIGTTCGAFGVRKCACCNVSKDNAALHNLLERKDQLTFPEIMEGMSEHMRNQLRQREERFLQIQQRDLLKHPELVDPDNSQATTPAPPAELSLDKREWIQRFIDSMSADRVDYDKPIQLNIVEGISHARPSVVDLNKRKSFVDPLDPKTTIVQRIDFEKENERRSKLHQSKIEEWLKFKTIGKFSTNELNATSTPRPLVLNRPASVENSPYMLPLDEVPESSRIPAANLQTYNVCTDQIPSTSAAAGTCPVNAISNDALEDCSLRTSMLLEDPNILTSTRIGSVLDEFSSDFAHLDRSNVTLRTPQSKRFREFEHLSMPSSSKPQVPMGLNKESDIMNLVDSLVVAEEESIRQEAHERCERMLKTVERTRNVLQDALDEVLITSDGSMDRYDYRLDNSVEIIEPFPEIPNNNPAGDINFVQLIESDEEVIPIVSLVDISDTPLPSTSRPIRSTRLKRLLEESSASVPKKKNKKGNASNLPSISEVAPTAPSAEPVSSATVENKPSVGSLRDCPICLESLGSKEISSTICGHVFCTPCITAAVRARRACPNCRTALTLKKIHPLFL